MLDTKNCRDTRRSSARNGDGERERERDPSKKNSFLLEAARNLQRSLCAQGVNTSQACIFTEEMLTGKVHIPQKISVPVKLILC